MHKSLYFKRFYSFLLIFSVPISAAVFAQNKKASAPKCSGAWTGVITLMGDGGWV